MNKSGIACKFAIEELLQGRSRCYLWTLTSSHCEDVRHTAVKWQATQRDLVRLGMSGVRVYELHPSGHGLHIHIITRKYLRVEYVRQVTDSHNWGRINVKAIPAEKGSYIAKYLGIERKYNHAGASMWEDIQYGTKEKSETALKEMVKYDNQDVITTEQIYLMFRKYITTVMHIGVLYGSQKYCCPTCGSSKIKLYKTTVTPSGTIQHIMQCQKDDMKFQINNTTYLKYINDKDGK